MDIMDGNAGKREGKERRRERKRREERGGEGERRRREEGVWGRRENQKFLPGSQRKFGDDPKKFYFSLRLAFRNVTPERIYDFLLSFSIRCS
jgi:hypothetical protein